jgi:hypothetical protein
MAPVVTGEVDVDALEELVRLCVELDRHRRGADAPGADDHDGTGRGGTNGDSTGGGGAGRPAGPDTARAWDALERAVIGKTTNFLLHSVLPSELQ